MVANYKFNVQEKKEEVKVQEWMQQCRCGNFNIHVQGYLEI